MNTSRINGGIFVFGIGAILVGITFFIVFQNTKGQNATPPESPDAPANHHGENALVDNTTFSKLIGNNIPDFSLTDKNGKMYTLDSFKGKNVVLFFNEGLMCYPACWNQIAAFPKDERFRQKNAEVISVVVDPPGQWQRAIEKMPELAAATVLFDQNGLFSKQLGILTLPSSMHRGSLPGHSYLIFNAEGKITFAYDDPNMAVNNDMLITQIPAS